MRASRRARSGADRRSVLSVLAALTLMTSVVAVGLAASGCGGAPATSTRVDKNDAVLTIECEVRDAELWVDDRFISEIGRLRGGIALSPGDHRIELRHDDYHTHYAEITVVARERRALEISLAERLP